MPRRILIIDTDKEFTKNLVQFFEKNEVPNLGKFVVEPAEQTRDILRKIKLEEYHLIIVCVELSRSSGYTICNRIKKDPDISEIPLILTSINATEETFEQHKKFKTSADGYLAKPFLPENLIDLMYELLAPETPDHAITHPSQSIAQSIEIADITHSLYKSESQQSELNNAHLDNTHIECNEIPNNNIVSLSDARLETSLSDFQNIESEKTKKVLSSQKNENDLTNTTNQPEFTGNRTMSNAPPKENLEILLRRENLDLQEKLTVKDKEILALKEKFLHLEKEKIDWQSQEESYRHQIQELKSTMNASTQVEGQWSKERENLEMDILRLNREKTKALEQLEKQTAEFEEMRLQLKNFEIFKLQIINERERNEHQLNTRINNLEKQALEAKQVINEKEAKIIELEKYVAKCEELQKEIDLAMEIHNKNQEIIKTAKLQIDADKSAKDKAKKAIEISMNLIEKAHATFSAQPSEEDQTNDSY